MRAVPIWKIDRITLDLDGTAALLFEDAHDKDKTTHGRVNQGQIDLTYAEAEWLIGELQSALQQCRELDALCEEEEKCHE